MVLRAIPSRSVVRYSRGGGASLVLASRTPARSNQFSNDCAAYRLCVACVKRAVIRCSLVRLAMSDTLPRSLPRSVSGSLSSSLSGSLPNSLSSSLGSATQSGNRFPQLRLESPFPAMWVGFFVFAAWTMIVLASASSPGELAAQTASIPVDQATTEVARTGDAWSAQAVARSSSVSALLLFGSSVLLGWVWLLTAGLAYVVRTDGIAARAFSRWAALVATLLITICDLHTSRRLLPASVFAFALIQSALLEFVLVFPVRLQFLLRWPLLRDILHGTVAVWLRLALATRPHRRG